MEITRGGTEATDERTAAIERSQQFSERELCNSPKAALGRRTKCRSARKQVARRPTSAQATSSSSRPSPRPAARPANRGNVNCGRCLSPNEHQIASDCHELIIFQFLFGQLECLRIEFD